MWVATDKSDEDDRQSDEGAAAHDTRRRTDVEMTTPVLPRVDDERIGDTAASAAGADASPGHGPASESKRGLARSLPDVAVLVGGLGVAFFAPFEGPSWLLLLKATAGAVLAAGTVATWRRERTRRELLRLVKELEDEQRRLRARLGDQTRLFRDTVKGVLALLAIERFGFTRDERVSLYNHRAGRLVLLGRFSLHPEYTRRPQRTIYAETQGCMGAAWRDGSCIVCFTPDPRSDPDAYARELIETWDMPENVAHHRRMPTRELAAFALLDPAGRRTVGVVVFESCRGDGLPLERIYRYMASPESRQLAEFARSERAPDIGMSMREDL